MAAQTAGPPTPQAPCRAPQLAVTAHKYLSGPATTHAPPPTCRLQSLSRITNASPPTGCARIHARSLLPSPAIRKAAPIALPRMSCPCPSAWCSCALQERAQQSSGSASGDAASGHRGSDRSPGTQAGAGGALGAAATASTTATKSAVTRRLTSRKEQAKALLVGAGATSCGQAPAPQEASLGPCCRSVNLVLRCSTALKVGSATHATVAQAAQHRSRGAALLQFSERYNEQRVLRLRALQQEAAARLESTGPLPLAATRVFSPGRCNPRIYISLPIYEAAAWPWARAAAPAGAPHRTAMWRKPAWYLAACSWPAACRQRRRAVHRHGTAPGRCSRSGGAGHLQQACSSSNVQQQVAARLELHML